MQSLEEILKQDASKAAPLLLGGILQVGEVSLRITETEAYQGSDDAASHAHKGRTLRNQVMFGEPGGLYVYLSYGLHWCLNIVTGKPGEPHAILLRAGRVVKGEELAKMRRGKGELDSLNPARLASGPGNLTTALAVNGTFNNEMLGHRVILEVPEHPLDHFQGPRVGVNPEILLRWRFFLEDPTVSKFRGISKKRASPLKIGLQRAPKSLS